jgi:hypothetical protein
VVLGAAVSAPNEWRTASWAVVSEVAPEPQAELPNPIVLPMEEKSSVGGGESDAELRVGLGAGGVPGPLASYAGGSTSSMSPSKGSAAQTALEGPSALGMGSVDEVDPLDRRVMD